jgi:dTDP-glucose 4,6-dehydratase
MKSILVTGGAGFIGSNFVRHSLAAHRDRSIVNFDKLTYAGNLENLEDVSHDPRYHFVQGDICDGEAVSQTMRTFDVDAVVHFAAESHVDRSILGATVFVETNVMGTQILLEASRQHGIERFLHVTTDEIYGSLGTTGRFREDSPIHPNSPYSASKAASDLLVLAYHRTYGFPAIVTHCSNNYGPYQFPEKLIPLMIANALDDKALPVYGEGANTRDWLYVLDHCTALDVVLERGRLGEVYNIGGDNEWKNIDIVRLLLRHLGKPERLISFVKDRPGHDMRYAIDATKLSQELGWRPSVSFEQGLADTIAWYKQNERWWRRVMSGEYQTYYKSQYERR